MIGRTLSHYTILEKLGSGGMGDVYVAEDTELSRKVALKVLPAEMAESEERRARFKREAKAIASLNHPNIVHVYSVEDAEGVHFITMELVSGKTLSSLIPKHGMPLGKFFEIAVPLADGVSAAHENGVIHRDLKPDNLMLNDEGRLKILDFGLAKLKQESAAAVSSELPTVPATGDGHIVGTVTYMSPEQAEGKKVDHRSDIFSIGIVLYEMATGKRPFTGETPTAVLSSILRDTPADVTEINPSLPPLLARIIRRCLVKDPERRYQSAKDIRNELEELKQDVESGDVLVPPVHKAVRSWRGRLLGAGVLIVIFLAAMMSSDLLTTESAPLRLVNPTQVTSALGVEDYPFPSPDGELLAYQSFESGNWDIWVAQVEEGQSANRTADYAGPDFFPSWSPDGQQLAFISERDGGGVFVMPMLGGIPRKVADLQYYLDYWWRGHAPQWSAGGKELAFLDSADIDQHWVELVSLSTGESRRVTLPAGPVTDLSWSPDGRYLAYVTGHHGLQIKRVWVLRLSDGDCHPVTDGRWNDHSPTWSTDSRTLFFVSNRGGSKDLWRQHLSGDGEREGEALAVTAGDGISHAAMSLDGSRLVYAKGGPVTNVWRVPLFDDHRAVWADAEQITVDETFIERLDVSPNGQRLVVDSDRRGQMALWVLPSDGGDLRQLTSGPLPDWGPSWSPDGTEIAFWSYRSGFRDIWTVPSGGGTPRQITYSEVDDFFPAWSPDGLEIVFQNKNGLWVVPAGGGDEARQLTSFGSRPFWSPDGEWISFWAPARDGGPQRVRPSGDDPIPLPVRGGTEYRWSPDSKSVYYVVDRDFWVVSVENGQERRLTDLTDRRGGLDMWADTDGEFVYFTWRDDVGDIWVMDVIDE